MASNQVSSQSQHLAEAATEQAAAIDETATRLGETLDMVKENSGSALKTNNIMNETGLIVRRAATSMETLKKSISDISEASVETQKIIKTIDEIAFQTNILALNASVEAARAGDAGAGALQWWPKKSEIWPYVLVTPPETLQFLSKALQVK